MVVFRNDRDAKESVVLSKRNSIVEEIRSFVFYEARLFTGVLHI
jgi:hypothetical protein